MFAQVDIGKTAASEQANKLIIADLLPSVCLHDYIIFYGETRRASGFWSTGPVDYRQEYENCMSPMYTHQKSNMRRNAGVKCRLAGSLAAQNQSIVEQQKQRQQDQRDQH